jgi:hypothetical protein
MAEALTGNLAQLPLVDLLKMLIAGGQTGRLGLSSGLDSGDLYLHQGAIVHAEVDTSWGESAFMRLVSWPNGQFRFEPHVNAPERSIDKPLDQLLADAARVASEREAIRRVVPSPAVTVRMARVAPGPSVTVDAADWELLATLKEEITVAEIGAEFGWDEFEAMKRVSRLKLAGLVELGTSAQAAAPVQAARALAGPQFFKALTAAVAGALGPLAEIIIDDTVEELGFTRATFPRDMVATLAERISSEIKDNDNRIRFQQTMLAMLRPQAA